MGVLSNRIDREDLKPGDHIYSWRKAYVYAHHGIYIGDDKVIHFTRGEGQEMGTGTVLDSLLVCSSLNPKHPPCPNCAQQLGSHGVVSSCLGCFLAGGYLYRFEYSVSHAFFLAKVRGGTCTCADADPAETVIHRATLLFDNGFGCYNIFKNNCEDFSIYCKTGLISVNERTIGQSGQAMSYFAFAFSSALRLVGTRKVYGMAVTITSYCWSRYVADIGMRSDGMKVSVEDLIARLAVVPSFAD